MTLLAVHKDTKNKAMQAVVAQSILGWTAKEIAAKEGVTPKTIQNRLSRGIQELNIPEILELSHNRLMSLSHKAMNNVEQLLDKGKLSDATKLKVALGIIDRSLGFFAKALLQNIGNQAEKSAETSKMSDESVQDEALRAAARLLAYHEQAKKDIKSEQNEVKTAEFEVIEQESGGDEAVAGGQSALPPVPGNGSRDGVTSCPPDTNTDVPNKEALSDKVILKVNRPARVIKRRIGRNMQRTRPAQPDDIEKVRLTKRFRDND